jgi:hypothetical protein
MEEVLATSICIFSFLGMVFIFIKKIPVLVSIPEEPPESIFAKIYTKIKTKIIQENKALKKSFWELQLQKIVAKIRILSLKVDNLTYNWLKKMREKSFEEEEEKKEEDFWDKIKEKIKKE